MKRFTIAAFVLLGLTTSATETLAQRGGRARAAEARMAPGARPARIARLRVRIGKTRLGPKAHLTFEPQGQRMNLMGRMVSDPSNHDGRFVLNHGTGMAQRTEISPQFVDEHGRLEADNSVQIVMRGHALKITVGPDNDVAQLTTYPLGRSDLSVTDTMAWQGGQGWYHNTSREYHILTGRGAIRRAFAADTGLRGPWGLLSLPEARALRRQLLARSGPATGGNGLHGEVSAAEHPMLQTLRIVQEMQARETRTGNRPQTLVLNYYGSSRGEGLGPSRWEIGRFQRSSVLVGEERGIGLIPEPAQTFDGQLDEPGHGPADDGHPARRSHDPRQLLLFETENSAGDGTDHDDLHTPQGAD